MDKKIDNLLVNKNSSIKVAMRKIDQNGLGVVFLVDDNDKFFSVVTDGDIRRAILQGVTIEKSVREIANRNPLFFQKKPKREDLIRYRTQEGFKKRMPPSGSLKIPVLDKTKRIKEIVFLYHDGMIKIYPPKNGLKFEREGIKRTLVIGGAGYLGSILCRKLLNAGFEVKVLDNLTYGDWGIRELYKEKKFKFLKGDIRNVSNIVEAIRGMDAVIHLAAIVGDPACKVKPKETLEINYLATKNIVETCKYFQINRFIFASTCSVYGKSSSPDEKLTEESPLNPVSLYAETKMKCEQGILEAMDDNFSPTILRMATLYGFSPNMRLDLVVNLLTTKALFDKKITILGGEQWRPWLHLDDAAQAYLACLRAPIDKIEGGIFNLASENHKVIEVGKIINSFCLEAKLEVSKKISDERDYNVSFDKISQLLKYQPRKKIIDGVMEIRNSIERGIIKDYLNPRYRITLS